MNESIAIRRLAQLAPVRDKELAGQERSPEARALLARVLASPARLPERTRRRRRAWVAVPGLAAAAGAVSVVVAVTFLGSGARTESAAAAALGRAARIAQTQPSLVPGRGEFVYTKSVNAYLDTVVPAGPESAFSALVRHVRETWLGATGGRLQESSGTAAFVTARDRERWIAAGRPKLGDAASETALPPTHALDLPTNVDALYERLRHDAEGHGSGLYGEMFTLVGDSLWETAATPAQRAALYRVAARIPGVRLVGRVRDNAGRTGTGVALDDHGIRFTLVFDPATSALLEERQVALPGSSFGYPPGTRTGYSTYLVQRIVDSRTSTT